MQTWKSKLPNWLTYSRIVAIPLIVAAFYLPDGWSHWTTSMIFLYAGITDYLDGYLARIWNVQSQIGRCLDPIADKLLVTAVLIMLVYSERVEYPGFFAFLVVIVLLREIWVSGLREFLMEQQIPMPVSMLAKYKTTAQLFSLFYLLLGEYTPDILPQQLLGPYLFYVAVILTILSGYDYTKKALISLNEEKLPK